MSESRGHNPSWVVPTADFHRYLPGQRVSANNDASPSNSLILNIFSFPTKLEETPAPATHDYSMGVPIGSAHGYCRVSEKLFKLLSRVALNELASFSSFNFIISHEHMNVTPHEYWLQCRVEKVQKQLLHGVLSVNIMFFLPKEYISL